MIPGDTLISVNPEKSLSYPISSIYAGRLVVTHAREERRVDQVLKAYYSGELYVPRVWGFNGTVALTAESQLLTYPHVRSVHGIVADSPIPDRIFNTEWKRAVHLDENDFLQIPTPYLQRNTVFVNEFSPDHLGRGGRLPNDQGVFARLRKIDKLPYQGDVYSLLVAAENSYVANGFVLRT